MNRSYWFFAALLFIGSWVVGCKSIKSSESSTVVKRDTIYIDTSKTVTLPLQTKVVIEELCDSVTGLPSDVNISSDSDLAALKIEIKDNKLEASINIDSIKQVAIREFRSTFDLDHKDKLVVETVTVIPRWAWWSLGINALTLLWLGFKLRTGSVGNGLSNFLKKLKSRL
jgi:hypothetical protein